MTRRARAAGAGAAGGEGPAPGGAARLLPPGAVEEYVEVPAGVLRVLRAGRGGSGHPPLVLLHGGGTDNAAISWYRAMAPLAAAGPRGEQREVWAIDLPGFGGSIDVPAVGGPVELAGVVADVMGELGIPSAVVFGVSMGGDVALTLALQRPELVAGLVLVAPGGLVPFVRDRSTHYWAWLAAQAPDWLLLPAGRFANRFVRTALRAIVRDIATLPPEVVDEFVREARDPRGVLGYARYNQTTLGRHGMLNDHTADVHRIAAPALFFHGEDDPIVDPGGSRRAAELMPRARLVMVPECGHWAQLEAHDRFVAEVRGFLSEEFGAG